MPVKPDLRQTIEAEITSKGDVKPQDMMGTTAYMVKGRMFAFWVADGLVVKLRDQERQDIVDKKRGALFQGPQGRGSGEWTRLHVEKKADVADVVESARKAYDYVKGGAAAVTGRSKAKKKSRK